MPRPARRIGMKPMRSASSSPVHDLDRRRDVERPACARPRGPRSPGARRARGRPRGTSWARSSRRAGCPACGGRRGAATRGGSASPPRGSLALMRTGGAPPGRHAPRRSRPNPSAAAGLGRVARPCSRRSYGQASDMARTAPAALCSPRWLPGPPAERPAPIPPLAPRAGPSRPCSCARCATAWWSPSTAATSSRWTRPGGCSTSWATRTGWSTCAPRSSRSAWWRCCGPAASPSST